MDTQPRKIRPKFSVREVPADQRSKRLVTRFVPSGDGLKDKNGNPSVTIAVEATPPDQRQFDVFFPNGSAIRLSEKRLKAMGFDGSQVFVDMNTGEEMTVPSNVPYALTSGAV